MQLKLYNVSFEPIYPVNSCLIILAYDENEARKIASDTLTHTSVFSIEEIDMDMSKIVIFQKGDY